jgi:hypothetical protein
MAMIMTEAQRPQVGEYHHRRVIEQIASPNPTPPRVCSPPKSEHGAPFFR